MILEIIIFNVGAGQTILAYPLGHPDYAMLIDCGGDKNNKEVIDYLVEKLPKYCGKPYLGCLAITHFDHDHFSLIPELQKKINIGHVLLPKNLSTEELRRRKAEQTNALDCVIFFLENYIYQTGSFNAPYSIYSDHLYLSDFECNVNTNHLGQIIFLRFGRSTICFPGDLEKIAMDKLLVRADIQSNLKNTNILVAPHHGRQNGYNESIFKYCKPNVIIISDKEIMYETQDGMSQKYGSHVLGDGINFHGIIRKVLTTRNESHLKISISLNGIQDFRRHHVRQII